jgi:ribonuclease VapC
VIAVDSSALMAIVLDEPAADACVGALADPDLLISAGTLAEALIVASRRGRGEEMIDLIAGLNITIVPVTEASARRIGEIYRRWGRGAHPAGLNFGDCFAYEVAKQHACRLLFVGDDFLKTDVESAL